MSKNFKILRLGLIITFIPFLASCSSTPPTAPSQPETGVVYNYKTNIQRGRLGRFTASQQAGTVVKASDGTVSINGIPFFKQGKDNTCGQATLTSILNFWGVRIDYQTVIDESNPSNFPTDINTIKEYLKIKGLTATTYKNNNIEALKSLVDKGRPPIVLLDFGGLNYEHYVVVSGYNTSKQTILINDPRNGANLSIKQSEFLDIWQNKSLGNLLIFGDKYYRPIIDVGVTPLDS